MVKAAEYCNASIRSMCNEQCFDLLDVKRFEDCFA